MEGENQYFVFTIDEQHYAIALSAVEKVIRAVELTSVPEASDILLGLINMKGKMIAVANIRKQFHLPDREVELNDRIIISRTSTRTIAFIVDRIVGVVEFPQDQVEKAQQIFPKMEHYIKSAGRFNGHIVIICNVDKLFSIQDTNRLNDPQPVL